MQVLALATEESRQFYSIMPRSPALVAARNVVMQFAPWRELANGGASYDDRGPARYRITRKPTAY